MTELGVVGLGEWARILIPALDEVATVSICASNGGAEGRDWLGSQYPGTRWTGDLEEILCSEVDAVVIATPIHTHAEIARRALQARKHVWVEKPIATKHQDAQALDQLARANERVLFVGHTFLFDSAYQELRDLTAKDEIVEARLRWNLNTSPEDSVLWSLLPHEVAICLDLFGLPPQKIEVESVRPDGHAVTVKLCFEGDRAAHITVDRDALRRHKRVEVLTRSGRRHLWENEVCYRDYDPETSGATRIPGARDAVRNEVRAYLAAVENGRPPRSDGAFGAEVTAVLEQLASDGLG